jgi:hypothetical protein
MPHELVTLVAAIEAWEMAKSWVQVPALTTYLQRTLNAPLSEGEVEGALERLERRDQIQRRGNQVRLVEPDRAEKQLYTHIHRGLSNNELLRGLGINGSAFVLQDTSLGGATNGRLERPDFILAASERGRFGRSLDVFSFEVKNRRGTSIDAVYDVRAHGRFVHYPYLVCPRSGLFPEETEKIRQTCENQEIGLIIFDMVVHDRDNFSVDRLRIKQKARRFSPERREVERQLESRFTSNNADELRRLMSGAA